MKERERDWERRKNDHACVNENESEKGRRRKSVYVCVREKERERHIEINRQINRQIDRGGTEEREEKYV